MMLPLSGCGDFLEVEPLNIITIDKFWNEETDVTSSIAGCYSALQGTSCLDRMFVWGEFRSDNVINNGTIQKDGSLEQLLQENITASNGYTNWSAFYDVINRCNIIMKYAPEVAAKDPNYSDSELKAHFAECTALRSLCYFYLIRTFRDVPYNEEAFIDDSQVMDLPASKFDDVLDKLIASLEEVKGYAIQKYPRNTTMGYYYQTGRITQQAIYAMLCEMYLWKKDYANCIKYADLCIEWKKQRMDEMYGGLYDFSEVNDFPLWSTKYEGVNDYYGYAFNEIFGYEGASDESIFELSFVKDNDNMLDNGSVNRYYGNEEASGYVKPSDFLATDYKSTSPKIFVNKSGSKVIDARAYENFRFTTSGDVTGINKFVSRGSIVLGDPVTSTFFSRSSWGLRYPKDKNKSNFIIYRIEDIMLLKAEALTQQMSDESVATEADLVKRDAAFWLINAVNKRSIMQNTLKDTLQLKNYPTKETITNLVYEERQREFLFEGKRYFDLVRRSQREGNTDYLRNHVKLKSTDNASMIENQLSRMDAIYWPYSLSEIKVNPNLVQNPAFSSGETGNYENSAKK